MLYEIRHLTEHHYDSPVRESVVELRMQPRQGPRQALVAFALEIDPPARLFSYVDDWGNSVHHFDLPQVHDRLDILARALVETFAQPHLPETAPDGEWDRLADPLVTGEHWDFLLPHGLARGGPALEAFVVERRLMQLKDCDPLSALKALNRTLYEAFDYEAGVTEPDSPIDHALAEGRGVCQDFAHIMLAICRRLGLPARYVSGYLVPDREGHDRSAPGATHAWIEAFLPSLGWIGFDPTNDALARGRHLAAAVGRDYGDAPPSHGVFKGKAEGRLSVGVTVRRSRERTLAPRIRRPAAPPLTAAKRRPTPVLDQHLQPQQ